jgi:hypothetical protein
MPRPHPAIPEKRRNTSRFLVYSVGISNFCSKNKLFRLKPAAPHAPVRFLLHRAGRDAILRKTPEGETP